MQSFLEFLKEKRKEAKRLKEDAIMSVQQTAPNTEVTSPENAVKVDTEVKAPSKTIGLSDNSVLGIASRKKKKNAGFFGKDDFIIPKNILSGEVETRID